MHRILVVEDDAVIAQTIQKHLSNWGYEVKCAIDFKDVLSCFVDFKPQLVLLDISLPFYNGYHWCGEIRKLSKVPIIFISSVSDNMNIVMAVNMGADDFIAKPFDLPVLTAKIQALLRRSYEFGMQNNILQYQGVILNYDDASLIYDGERLDLTHNEYKIMRILMENGGKIVSRELLMTMLWKTDSYIDDNTLTVNIARLRRKLENLGLGKLIATKKGLGYQLK